jgi:YbbR domain-containing protein
MPSYKVHTLRVNLDKMKESQDFPLSLSSPHEFLHLEQSEVSASFRVAPLQDRTLANIPVIPLVDAGQPEVGVSPPVVDLMVRGVADSVQALDRSRFLVTVPVGSLAEGVYQLAGQVDYPPWLTLIGMNPEEFQVIVGNPEPVEIYDSLADSTLNLPEGGGFE